MRLLWLFFFLSLAELTFGQHSYLMHVSGGSLLPHRESVRPLITEHLLGADFQWRKKVSGNEIWHQLYGLPELGILFNFSNLGNKGVLGQQWSLSPFIQLPLGKNHRSIRQHLQFGLGVGYTNTVWDVENNVKSTVLSSHFNASILLEYGLEGDLNGRRKERKHRLFWSTGVRLHHFSNAAWKMPNLGTNNFLVLVGLGMQFKPETASEKTMNFKSLDFKPWSLLVSYGLGFRENNPPLGVRHAIHTLRLEGTKRITAKSSIGLSPEILFNRSLAPLLTTEESTPSTSDLLQAGLALQYTMHFDQVRFHAMMGTYVHNKSDFRGALYSRIGLRYQFGQHFSTHLMLKTHAFKADHAEIGIAYQLGSI